MARMVATKAALSIRVDALSDADGKSEPQAPSIGLENRAKLEARLHSLEQQGDASTVRSAFAGKKQARFQMTGETKTYNTAADAVDLVPTQREPMEAAVKAVMDVKAEKAEKKKAKEERKAKKRAEKEQIAEGIEEARMDVDGEDEDEDKERKKEKKRKRRESEAMDVDAEEKVGCLMSFRGCSVADRLGPAKRGDEGGAESEEEGSQGGGGGCGRGSCCCSGRRCRCDEKEEEEKVGSIADAPSARLSPAVLYRLVVYLPAYSICTSHCFPMLQPRLTVTSPIHSQLEALARFSPQSQG